MISLWESSFSLNWRTLLLVHISSQGPIYFLLVLITSCCCAKIPATTMHGEKGVCLADMSGPQCNKQSNTEGRNSTRAGIWRQELKWRPWRNTAYYIAQPAFFYNPWPIAKGSTTRSGLGRPTTIINKENTPQTWPKVNEMEIISQLTCPLLKWPNLCPWQNISPSPACSSYI